MGDIERRYETKTATIANGAALSDAIDMGPFAGGVLVMPSGWTAASIGFQVCDTIDGTYTPLYTTANALVELTVAASRAYPLPDQLFGARFVKVWSETSAVGVNQGAARSIKLQLKG